VPLRSRLSPANCVPSSEDPFGEQDDLLRLEQDVIVPLAASRKLFVYESTDFWRQIKTAGSAVPASALYLAQFQKTNSKFLTAPGKAGAGGPTILPPVFIDPTAEVDDSAKIGPNVSLGESLQWEITRNVHGIDADTFVTLLGPNVRIAAGARVKDAILMEGAFVDVSS
jgi:mannose-1-phosphate guanylyltransferase